jgi:hypothetical protein
MSNCILPDAKCVVDWIKENSGFWEPSLEVRESPLGGVGVFATRAMEPSTEQTVLLRLHKDSLLSSKKSCIANIITDEEIDGVLALILSFIYEREQRENSPWAPYINTIKYHDAKGKLILPPSLWEKEQQSLLSGTELEFMGGLDDEETQMAYERSCSFALSQHELSKGSIPLPFEFDIIDKEESELLNKYEQFVAIAHQIAARDFEIDEFHEVALCPGADLFNHSVRNSVRFESLFDVCNQCGDTICDHLMTGGDIEEVKGHSEEENSDIDEDQDQEDNDLHYDDVEQEEGEEDEEPEFEGTMEEFIEAIESALAEEKKFESEQLEEEQPHPQLFDNEKPIEADDCCDIVLHHFCQPGDELFNTYGDFSNSVLLSKYGFVIPNNPNDVVGLGIQFLKLKKKKQFSRVFDWWDQEGCDIMRDYLHSSKHSQDHAHDDCESNCGDCGEDGCCGDEDSDIPNWSMEMKLQHSGEPTPLTFALGKLLSLNSAEVQKFLGKKTKVNPQFLTTTSTKAYKLLAQLVAERKKMYGDANYRKLVKSKNYREKAAAQLVLDELDIIDRATQFINKRA